MKTITKIHSNSLAKILGLMYTIIGLVFGAISLAIFLLTLPEGITGPQIALKIALPFGLIFLYGIMGWVGGYLVGWLYNFIANRIGGIKFEIE